ncbi:class I SAM-dependent methyltransferase [Winogradskyella litoriviva]|uniref:Class I SAM-dependent methyltransferase n=1 Tax=Winogradskyella litoriviva TaxID=1220182 RepID=A0ABX2E329_9FLAO|nr:class I SAM-dependent methyltransferase [Winogradskyella litoriviva]NRD22895.1 class I SAM-dependent methyltransferase [Winogradskyella litoriviva]
MKSSIYNKIGINYNQTRKADPYLTEQFLKHLNPKKGGLYLDVGCGTGNYTNALQQKGFQFMGIDPSIEMLKQAHALNKNIEWNFAAAEKTNLDYQSIDGIMATLTLHHWPNITRAFSEFKYILKPNGKIVIFSSTPQQMKGYWLNHYFPKMLEDSMKQMPSFDAIETAMNLSGLKISKTELYNIKPDLEDQFLYCGKYNPELYFDESIRNGISSFCALANITEVEQGLHMLRNDIDSGKIDEIIKSYENNLGDYLYIIAEKTNL